MTSKNNFDTSSTGVNIELLAFRDGDRSRSDFEENIEILQHSGSTTTSVGYYIDNGNLPKSDEVTFTLKGKKEDILKYILANGHYYNEEETKKMKKPELVDLFLETLDMNNSEILIAYALDKLPELPVGLDLVPSKELRVISTHGYCQGDYAKVIYSPEDCKKVWGSNPVEETIKTMVGHYYWDSPVYARFEIDGKEFDYFDQSEFDEYDWEPEKFAEYVAKESGVDIEQLKAMLPQHLEYI